MTCSFSDGSIALSHDFFREANESTSTSVPPGKVDGNEGNTKSEKEDEEFINSKKF